MNKILIVEDDETIIKGLKYALSKQNFDIDFCLNKTSAIEKIYKNLYDVVILDIGLPDGTGYDICKEIKSILDDTPVIFLTARDDENSVVKAFNIGAEDYIVKPFRNRELVARIHNVLRRYDKDNKEISSKNVKIDLMSGKVYLCEKEVELTALEFKILVLLFQNKGKLLKRADILYKIWDFAGNVVNDNTLTVYIKRIREKLGEDLIHTVKGIGYRVD